MMIGIDKGEEKRAKLLHNKGIENRWPLIEHNIDRNGCKAIVESHGLPVPMRSGCYICPMQRVAQWKELRRKHPCLFQRAVNLEKANMALRREHGKKPLTLSGSRKRLEVIVDENQLPLWEEHGYPPCECELT
jgi:hypothetical protein